MTTSTLPSGTMQPAPEPPAMSCIPLEDKRVPTEMRSAADHETITYAALVASVGEVSIAALRQKLLALPEEHWTEEYNRVHNVHFQRPFHDKLGVGNIMAIFSDTQLETVLELPMYDEYKPYLTPIFEKLNLQPDQVVRCLFARMPGHTLIPPHHDNGPWVSKTHRVHVPIVTYPEVEFSSGPLEESMKRYAFNEGSIVELNNAAKHSVYNPLERHRIHLIFDYVETSQLVRQRRQKLSPGQICQQVRGRVHVLSSASSQQDQETGRKKANALLKTLYDSINSSVDKAAAEACKTAVRHFFIEQINAKTFVRTMEDQVLQQLPTEKKEGVWQNLNDMFDCLDTEMKKQVKEARFPPLTAPNWVIIGAQKCGTTSLYDYLGQNPDVVKGERREPHFFDRNWSKAVQIKLNDQVREVCDPILTAYSKTREEEEVDDTYEGNSIRDLRIKYICSLQYKEERPLCPPVQIGESTPSYLVYGEPVAKRLKALYPEMKLIIMLRDPVKRAYSHFQMTADPSGTPAQLASRKSVQGKPFQEVIDDDLALLQSAGVTGTDVASDEVLNKFQDYADNLPLDHGSHSYVGRGLYAFQIALWLRVFSRNQILILDMDDMKTDDGVQQTTTKACEFVDLKPHQVADARPKNTRSYEPIPEDMEKRLREFYRPYNEQLFALLGHRLNWK